MKVIQADYLKLEHQQAIRDLMDHYALDPMGGGEAIPPESLATLPQQLNAFGKAVSFLAVDAGEYLGLINCIEGFSTFKVKPLLNIHDVVVRAEHRGKGITQQMLAAVEQYAVKLGCCKLTLEVLEGNVPAKTAYEKFGFAGYELDPQMGRAMFWQKKLS